MRASWVIGKVIRKLVGRTRSARMKLLFCLFVLVVFINSYFVAVCTTRAYAYVCFFSVGAVSTFLVLTSDNGKTHTNKYFLVLTSDILGKHANKYFVCCNFALTLAEQCNCISDHSPFTYLCTCMQYCVVFRACKLRPEFARTVHNSSF